MHPRQMVGIVHEARHLDSRQRIQDNNGQHQVDYNDLPIEPLAKLRRGSARFVASGASASAILRDCSGIAWYSAASERFWVTSGKPMAALPRNGGKALMSCLGANALR
jgi:hypothetical protein